MPSLSDLIPWLVPTIPMGILQSEEKDTNPHVLCFSKKNSFAVLYWCSTNTTSSTSPPPHGKCACIGGERQTHTRRIGNLGESPTRKVEKNTLAKSQLPTSKRWRRSETRKICAGSFGGTRRERYWKKGTMSSSVQSSKQQEQQQQQEKQQHAAPIKVVLRPPSTLARYGSASAMVAVFAVWGKMVFVDEETCPGIGSPMHNWVFPLAMSIAYLVSLPLLRRFSETFLEGQVDVKLLLRETMVVYNAGQVLLNLWMVYRFLDAVLFRGHPFIGDRTTVDTGAAFAVWIHYCDKYLEFFDTFFMVLRGRMDQVRKFHFDIFYGDEFLWRMPEYGKCLLILPISHFLFHTFISLLFSPFARM